MKSSTQSDRKSVVVVVVVAIAAAAALVASAGCSRPPQHESVITTDSPPNVVLIVMDTTRADHLSHNGWLHDTSPNLSALLDDAVLYSAAHSVAPWTLPSHMSLFTGQLPGKHGAHWAAFDPETETTLAGLAAQTFQPGDPARMLPRRLQDQGYTTIGISSNPWISTRTGFGEGFNALYPVWKETIRPDPDQAPSPEELPLSDELTGGASNSLLALNHHLRTHGLAEPFFLFFNFIDPHYPYLSPGPAVKDFGGDPDFYRRMADPQIRTSEFDMVSGKVQVDPEKLVPLYDACIHHVDQVIGLLIRWLQDQELYDNTMIVVTSDHGEHLGEEGRFSHQLSVEEELLRIPLVIKYPDSRDAGRVESNPHVSIVDVYQTILAGTGAASLTETESFDLADMDGFARPYAFAEYHFSNAYLDFFVQSNPAFDVGSHRSTYHVVYAGGRKFVFKDLELDQTQVLYSSASDELDLETRDLVTEVLARHATQQGRIQRSSVGEEEDPALIEALRALGYLGED